MPRVLFYSQDPGGANVLALVAREATASARLPQAIVAVHPFSRPTFERLGVSGEPLEDLLPSIPAGEEEVERWLREGAIDRVVCTTSSQVRDPTNGRVIAVARRLGIPTLGFLDHWLGFDRFVDEQGQPAYLPDVVACIDEYCVARMASLGLRARATVVVGHPHLEASARAAAPRAYAPGSPVRLLLVSQPSLRRDSFEPLFQQAVEGRPFLSAFGEIVRAAAPPGIPIAVAVRAHPKERGSGALPPGLTRDATRHGPELLDAYDVFVGATSMVLIEASVAGRHVIRFEAGEWQDAAPDRLPAHLGGCLAGTLAELASAIAAAVARLQAGQPPSRPPSIDLRDSLVRACRLVNRFVADPSCSPTSS